MTFHFKPGATQASTDEIGCRFFQELLGAPVSTTEAAPVILVDGKRIYLALNSRQVVKGMYVAAP